MKTINETENEMKTSYKFKEGVLIKRSYYITSREYHKAIIVYDYESLIKAIPYHLCDSVLYQLYEVLCTPLNEKVIICYENSGNPQIVITTLN